MTASEENGEFGAVDSDGHTTIIVLGASGDLAKKKTFPAIFNLLKHNFITPGHTDIIGYARSKLSREDFETRMLGHLKEPTKELKATFLKMCSYVAGTYEEPDGFIELEKHIQELEKKSGAEKCHRLFYMALPPTVFIPCAKHLKENCYGRKGGWNRLIVEKPFGKDLDSSRTLANALAKYWTEAEVYRIDHYLGKEMVKNIIAVRFGNIVFSNVWNRNCISNVQITFKEPFGTEGRGGYFDEYGIIRDVMQNHLLQVLTLVAMERPITLSAADIRNEKVRVLRSLEPLDMEDMLFGQYVKSRDGERPGYLDDKTVPKGSRTPTFCCGVFRIQNERWEGVPFIIKSGKALNEAKVEVRIQFKDIPGLLFDQPTSRNEFVIRLQPNESIYLKLMNKVPGLGNEVGLAEMDLSYKSRFPEARIPDAYEALVLDVLAGDQANFVRSDELDLAWQLFTPILEEYEEKGIQPEAYEYGSRGPEQTKDFMARYGFVRDRTQYTWVPKENKRPGSGRQPGDQVRSKKSK